MEESPSVNLEDPSLSYELIEKLREKTGFLITGYPGKGHVYEARRNVGYALLPRYSE